MTICPRPRLEPKRRYLYPQVGDTFFRKAYSLVNGTRGLTLIEVTSVGAGHLSFRCTATAHRSIDAWSVPLDTFQRLAGNSMMRPGAVFYPAE